MTLDPTARHTRSVLVSGTWPSYLGRGLCKTEKGRPPEPNVHVAHLSSFPDLDLDATKRSFCKPESMLAGYAEVSIVVNLS